MLIKCFVVVRDNVVAGADRVAYSMSGESCTNSETYNENGWNNNEARSVLFGILHTEKMCETEAR